MTNVAILGGGAGAIFAYYGALEAGCNPVIYADKLTFPPGAFWLYELPVPDDDFQPECIHMRLVGSPDLYSRMQWGTVYPTSADELIGNDKEVMGYNPHQVLPRFWSMANRFEFKGKFNQWIVDSMADEFEYVIQTFSLDNNVKQCCSAYAYPTYVTNLPHSDNRPNLCIHNGMPDVPWVRTTIAFDKISIEYPADLIYQQPNILRQQEEIWGTGGTVYVTPDIHPEVTPIEEKVVGERGNILLTGRWTTLDRKHLSHHTKREVFDFLKR